MELSCNLEPDPERRTPNQRYNPPHECHTTHVLDTSLGRPAAGCAWCSNAAASRANGRCRPRRDRRGWPAADPDGRTGAAPTGLYRLVFDTRRYFDGRGVRALYPSVIVTFEVTEDGAKMRRTITYRCCSVRSATPPIAAPDRPRAPGLSMPPSTRVPTTRAIARPAVAQACPRQTPEHQSRRQPRLSR